MDAAQSQDEQLLKNIVKFVMNDLTRHALRLREWADPQEIAADFLGWLCTTGKLQRFTGNGFDSWKAALFVYFNRYCIDQHRTLSKQETPISLTTGSAHSDDRDHSPNKDIASTLESPLDALIRQEDIARCLSCLQHFVADDEDKRKAFEYWLDGMQKVKIAHELGRSVRVIEDWIARFLTRAKTQLIKN